MALKLLIAGHGRMATAVEMAAKMRGHEVTGFVSRGNKDDWRTVHVALEARPADAVIDFTAPEAIDFAVAGCLFNEVPLVTGTVGWQERLGYVTKLVQSGEGALLHSTNFALGAQLFLRTVSAAAELFGRVGDHDVAIEERGPRSRPGMPSPTAAEMARRVIERMPAKKRLAPAPLDRPPEGYELHVASLRSGSETGRHAIVFDGEDDVVELVHQSRGRRGVAMGAVRAAEWLVGRSGVFTLDDMIDDLLTATE